MAVYDVNAAIQKPNMLGALQQGYAFGAQQRQVREEEQRQNQLRTLAPSIISGDPQAFEQAAAIDPQAAQQYQGAGDNQLRRLKGGMDYLKAAMESGNAQRIAAAEAQVGPYVSRIAGKPWTPGSLTADPGAFEQAYARISMLPQDASQDPAGFRQAHLTAVASGYQPGTPEYQRAMQVAAGTAPRAIPAGYTPRMYRDENGREVMELVQNRGEDAGRVILPGGPQGAPSPAPSPPPNAAAAQTALLGLVGNGVVMTSGIRTPSDNTRVGGTAGSQHMSGTGADYVVPESQKAAWAANARAQGFEVIDEGDHMHVELPPGGEQPTMQTVANVTPPPAAPQPLPANMVGGGPIAPFAGSGRGQTDQQRAAAAAEQAAAIERARLGVQSDFAPTQAQQAAEAARLAALAKADAERQGERIGKQSSYQVFETAMKGLEDGLAGTSTGFFAGKLPAMTEGQQIAEGGVATMAPILKSLFRTAGEGTFTDKDQELLMAMVPTRNDLPAARDAKIAGIRAVVQAKMGVGANGGDPSSDAPPVEGARKAPDGNWYVQRDGQTFKVEQ